MKQLMTIALIFFFAAGLGQNDSPLKQSEPARVSGDTVFIFEGEKLFFKCKRKGKKISSLREIGPTSDSSNVLILNFRVLDPNLSNESPSIITFYNPYKKTLYYKTHVKYNTEKLYMREACLPASAKDYARLIWSKRVTSIKVFDLHFK